MTVARNVSLAALSLALGAAACGGDDAPPGPSISITSPAASASVTMPASKEVPISFTAPNFQLKAPGTCAGAAGCGHVHLRIDDNPACDAPGSPYNNAGASSPILAKFQVCTTGGGVGAHTIKLELHDDAHKDVPSNGSAKTAASVAFTLQ